MRNPNLDIYTSDGRINPDKAFALIRDTMKTLTPEEFRRINSAPFQMRGIDNGVVRTFPDQSPAVEPPSPVQSKKAEGIPAETKPRSTPKSGKSRTKAVKKASS